MTTDHDQVLREEARIHAEIRNAGTGSDPFSAAVRATRMPMIITDPRLPDNPVVFVNNAFCRLSGYTRGEILGRNCRFLQGPGTDPEVRRQIREAVAAAQPLETDIRNYRKDGTPFWNRLLLAPVHDAEGNLNYFFASQVDVTLERERLEGLQTHNAALMAELSGRLHALQESEARLRFAADAGRMGFWEIDAQDAALSVSGRFAENFGLEDNTLITQADMLAAIDPADRARVEAGIKAAIAGAADLHLDCRVQRRTNGEPAWVQLRAQRAARADGTPVRLAGIVLDITKRKRAETELQAVNQSLEARVAERTAERDRAWRTSQDLLVVLDGDGILRAVNPAWETVLGRPAAELVGRHFLDVYDVKDREKALEIFHRTLTQDLPGVDSTLRHRDGSARCISWIASPAGGHVYARGRDITAEKDAAAALAHAEELLRQSQKMEAVGQLTGGIAHDFNNLLAGISGSLELVQRRVESGRTDQLERYTSAALTACHRAAGLTQRLLAFARRQPLDPKRVDANRLVSSMEDLLRRTIGPGIALEMVLSGGLWTTLCDPNQLESAILNLAINARDAMGDAGRLTIETGNAHLDDAYAKSQGGEVRPGQYVAISVTDTGCGMTPDVLAKVFDPFFTTKPIGQGTGLGLSMLYGFIKQSEGHVRIYSEPGQGTTFRLYLPRQRGTAEAGEEFAAPAGDMPQAEAGETVLVVDDEPTLRMLVTETLQDLGYAAIEAADGNAALRILQSDARVDLLVTDVGLPGMNGRQLADAARQTRPRLRVLFITGYAHNAAIGNGAALEPGMEIVTKPFALDALAAKIRDMIERP